MDAVELVMAFEEEFDISISDEEAVKLFTPRHTALLIAQKLESDDRSMDIDKIDEMLKMITIDQLGINPQIYHLDARYITDFGMD